MRRSTVAVATALTVLSIAEIALFLELRRTATDFDEGVYILSVRALEAGQSLGGDIFAAQPPGFYWLLRLGAAILGDGVGDLRVWVAALSVLGVVGAWAAARPAVGSGWALLPASLLAVAPPVPLYGARVLADLPSLWLAVAAVGLAATATTRSAPAWPVAAGVALTAAASVKLAAAIVLPCLAIVLWSRRRLLLAAGGAIASGVVVLLVHAGRLGSLWESAVVYHRRARSTPPVLPRGEQLDELVGLRAPFTWLAALALVLLAWGLWRRRVGRLELAFWTWAALSGVFLLVHAPLHPNHVVFLPVPLALAAGTTIAAATGRLPGQRELGVAVALALVVVVANIQQHRRLVAERTPEPAGIREAARLVAERTASGDVVLSDVPAVAVLAHRLVPGALVDTARLRFETRTLTTAEVLENVDRACVRAAAIGRAFAEQPGLAAAIASRFRTHTAVGGLELSTRRRSPCRAVR